MTGKERLVAALDRKPTDRLPVTTHHIIGYFRKKYLNGGSNYDFFKEMGLDPICWVGDYQYSAQRMDNWRIEREIIQDTQYHTERIYVHTPEKTLTMVRQSNEYTGWIAERLLKEKKDIEILERYMPAPTEKRKTIERAAEGNPDCLIRGTVPGLGPAGGQAGCWQDLAMLFGVEDLIMETFDDPEWVKEALSIIQKKKMTYVESLEGCPFDVLEMGGGDASTTVISPAIFDEFVAPYDAPLVKAMQEKGQRVVYHTCGGMMPILESLADMGCNALETFTPVDMGGDTNLAEAKRRIGDRVCMIGGFDQGHYFMNCTPQETRKNVRKCFEEAGAGGGFILSPSDHFFDADPELIRAFAEEAARCIY